MSRRIAESFIALKAVDGAYTPPIGAGNYRPLMDRKWHKDPNCGGDVDPILCQQGWHAFPLDSLERWWPEQSYTMQGDRHIWVVEMSGYAEYSSDKMCSTYIRFIDRLSKIELGRLANYAFNEYGWPEKETQARYRSAAKELKLEGLVLCSLKGSSPGPRLIRVSADGAPASPVRVRKTPAVSGARSS